MTPNERNGSGAGGGAERDPRLDRAYGAGAREEPPAHLDAAILAAARREVGARPHAVSPRLRAWRVPVSIAAVVVLSVSLVTLVREEGGGQLERSSAMFEYSKRTEPAPAPPPAAAPEAAKAPAHARPPSAAPAARQDAAADATASARLAEEDSRRAAGAFATRPAEPEPQAPPRAAAPSPQPFQAAPAAREQRPALAVDQAIGAGIAAQSAGVRGETEWSVAPSEPVAAPKSAASNMQRDRAATSDIAGIVSRAPAPAAKPSAKLEVRAPQSGPALADAGRVATLIKEFDAQPPEKWLEKIEALRREGRKGEADDMLAEFKRRFPGHPLPTELQ